MPQPHSTNHPLSALEHSGFISDHPTLLLPTIPTPKHTNYPICQSGQAWWLHTSKMFTHHLLRLNYEPQGVLTTGTVILTTQVRGGKLILTCPRIRIQDSPAGAHCLLLFTHAASFLTFHMSFRCPQWMNRHLSQVDPKQNQTFCSVLPRGGQIITSLVNQTRSE